MLRGPSITARAAWRERGLRQKADKKGREAGGGPAAAAAATISVYSAEVFPSELDNQFRTTTTTTRTAAGGFHLGPFGNSRDIEFDPA